MLLMAGRHWQPGGDQMTTAQDNPPRLVNEKEVAELLRVSVASIRRWRLLKRGPTFIKVGAAVRYKSEDLNEWLESRRTGGEREGR